MTQSAIPISINFTFRYKLHYNFDKSFIASPNLLPPQNPPFKTPQPGHLMTRYNMYRPI